MKRKERPHFYAFVKDPNSGDLKRIDVLNHFFNYISGSRGRLLKSRMYFIDDSDPKYHCARTVRTKEQLAEKIQIELMGQYWSRTEYEMYAVDWPYKGKWDETKLKDNHPIKFDVYWQIKPNLPIIVDMAWEYLKDKIQAIPYSNYDVEQEIRIQSRKKNGR